MEALCGMEFKHENKDQETQVKTKLKVPILNNIALCLLKKEEYAKSKVLLNQVTIHVYISGRF
jgi:hypothetical protein